jgi:hypothetical protein
MNKEGGHMPLVWDNGDETHAGLVVGGPYTRCVRVMSDIYSDENYAQVWNPNTKRVDEVHIGGAFELNTRRAQVVVDASTEVLEAMAKQREAAAAVAAKAAVEAEVAAAKAEVLTPRMGCEVQVVAGKKVPKGTKGVMVWQNDPKAPTRIGIDGADGVRHWVDLRWCHRVYPDFPVGGEPACGWVAYRDAQRDEEARREAALPKLTVGQLVALSSGLTGNVFWVKGDRVGVRLSANKDAKGYYTDVVWTNVSDVVAGPAPAKQEPTVFVPHDEEGVELPWPYSAITHMNVVDGMFAAYNAKGEFLLHLDGEGADEVFRLMPYVALSDTSPKTQSGRMSQTLRTDRR